jgi:transposase, IS5 family
VIVPKQRSFESGGFEKYKKKTRRERFLEEMESAVPWRKLLSIIEPFYHPGPGPQGGRPPAGLSKMFRIHCLQHWFNLSDPGVEDALHESPVLRRFVGIDLGIEPVPDETTIMRFRHLLEENGLSKDLFEAVNDTLRRKGLMLKKGTIVDATIIDAPSSTKNEAKERDPEMCQTKKGNQWYFGMKLHIGVDERSTLIHSLDVTAANVADANCIANLLHGEEVSVWGDQGYAGRTDVIAQHAPQAADRTNRRVAGLDGERERERNRRKSKVRAKVEHPFLTIKRTFGFTKTRLRGMLKNTERLYLTCALANLHRVRYRLST